MMKEAEIHQLYRKFDRQPLKLQNGHFHMYCINTSMYGIVKQNDKGYIWKGKIRQKSVAGGFMFMGDILVKQSLFKDFPEENGSNTNFV